MKKDYSNKVFKNTLFGRKTRNQRRLKKYFYGFGLLFIIALIIILFTETFHINKIKIIGGELINGGGVENFIQKNLNEKNFMFFAQKNIFFFKKGQMEKKLSEQYNFQSVQIKKKFPNSIHVLLREKKPFLLLREENKNYYIDAEGNVISNFFDFGVEKSAYDNYNILRHINFLQPIPTIYNQNKIIKNNSIEKKYFDLIKNFLDISKNHKIVNVNHYALDSDKMYITILVAEGWKIYMDLTLDIENQFRRLKLILDNKIKIGKILDYIDLRYGDKIYYQ